MPFLKYGSRIGARVRKLQFIVVCWLLWGFVAVAADTVTPKNPTGSRSFTTGNSLVDFAPGVWTDGVDRHLSDYQGKVVIVFSFDPSYLDSPKDVKKKLELYDLFRDKPVAFLGVINGRRDINLSKALLKPIDVKYPMYFDNIGQMSATFSGEYSVYLRMIHADGTLGITSVTPSDVDAALKDVKWKYRDGGYDKKLDGIVDLLEWNHYQLGLKQLRPLRKSINKELAASAEKLFQDVVHAEGEKWKAEADAAVESDPVAAFDQYSRIASAFAGEDLAKGTVDPLKKLKISKPLQDEFAARDMFSKLNTVIPRAKYEQRLDVADYCESISKKYPQTLTGKKAKSLYDDIMSARTLR